MHVLRELVEGPRNAREGGEIPPLPRNCDRRSIGRAKSLPFIGWEDSSLLVAWPEVRRPVPGNIETQYVSREDVS